MDLFAPNVHGFSVLLVFAAAARCASAQQDPPAPTQDEQRAILTRVSRESFRYQRELPDLICTQLTTRSVDETGTGKHWKKRDRLEVEDVYVDRFLNHKLLMLNGKNPKKNYQQLDGLLSETVLHSLGFLPAWMFGPQAKTRFEWRNWSIIDESWVHVFSARLPASESQFLVTTNRQSVVAGIDAAVYVDAATQLVRRLEIQMDLPAGSVIQNGFVRIDFGRVIISERQYLLPLTAEVRARVAGSLERNDTEVIRYQRYAADSTVHFDDPSAGPQ